MRAWCNRIAVAMLCFCLLPHPVWGAEALAPGGQVIGLELQEGSVTVAAFDDVLGEVCRAAGIAVGDEIKKIDHTDITSSEDVRWALEHSDGTVEIQLIRSGKSHTVKVSPQITAEGPKLGVYLRQGITGIGTVTWYDPETGRFGTLGHGVNSGKGTLLNMIRGNAYAARVASVRKGRSGEPGQLLGAIESKTPIGELTANTMHGVFGTTTKDLGTQLMPVADAGQVHTGKAVIRSTVSGDEVREYSVEILKIYPKTKNNGRNLLIKVTDAQLLVATGGIVQGMSGSPIIQDGKLIGAVTHVLVNDPTTGYGIFTENMLETANQMAEEQAKKDAS